MSTSAPADPLASVALRLGHRELLATLRELIAEGEGPGEEMDPYTLRATLAFLRQEVVPFARSEEALLAGDPAVWEGVAFEHAFLEAEIDRLGAEAAALLAVPADGAGTAPHRVRRTLHRIEAVLELHLDREGERAVTAGPETEAAAHLSFAPAPAAGPAAQRMSHAEAAGFLRERSWGVLGTADGVRPYGVPIHYGFDGRSLYFASGPGRKASNLSGSPAVCLTVPEITDGTHWRCVVVTGTAETVESVAARVAAIRTLAGAAGAGFQVSASAWKRLATARLYRITPAEISGRRRGG